MAKVLKEETKVLKEVVESSLLEGLWQQVENRYSYDPNLMRIIERSAKSYLLTTFDKLIEAIETSYHIASKMTHVGFYIAFEDTLKQILSLLGTQHEI